MESFPVSKLVNSPRNETAECVKPMANVEVSPEEEQDLFSSNRHQ